MPGLPSQQRTELCSSATGSIRDVRATVVDQAVEARGVQLVGTSVLVDDATADVPVGLNLVGLASSADLLNL